MFDIVDFYPSISEDLLNASLEYAKGFTDISDDAHKIILQARSSFLINKQTQWIKKGNSTSDVAMGS